MLKKLLKKIKYKCDNTDYMDRLVREVETNEETRKIKSLSITEINKQQVMDIIKNKDQLIASIEDDKIMNSEIDNKVIDLAEYRKSKENL